MQIDDAQYEHHANEEVAQNNTPLQGEDMIEKNIEEVLIREDIAKKDTPPPVPRETLVLQLTQRTLQRKRI